MLAVVASVSRRLPANFSIISATFFLTIGTWFVDLRTARKASVRKTDRASGAEMSFFVLRPAVKLEKTSGRRCKYHLSALNAQFGTLNVAFSKKEI